MCDPSSCQGIYILQGADEIEILPPMASSSCPKYNPLDGLDIEDQQKLRELFYDPGVSFY